jgi:hypothetical protein
MQAPSPVWDSAILERSEQFEALKGALETDKAELKFMVSPHYFTVNHGRHEVPSSISVASPQGEVLVTFQNRYSLLPDETGLLSVLGVAVPKSDGPGGSPWTLEGKYNGWRAWVHQPTRRMFNRKNEPLSITDEFEIALNELCQLPFEWLDVEALERRHKIGRGSLILLDAPDAGITYTERKACLNLVAGMAGIPVHKELNIPIADNSVYLPMTWRWEGAAQLWDILQQCNAALGCQFWEGVVAKRNDSIYPKQLRSPEVDFPFWMKHRWAF